MANEKILNTRIILKNDTLAAFNDSTFIPKKGEMLLASIETKQHDGQIVPTYLIKVGDGKHTFSKLNYAAAQAADVYAWAKAASVSFNVASEQLQFKDADGKEVASVDLGHFASNTDLAALQEEVSTIDTNTTYSFTIDDNGDLVIKSKEKGDAEADVITVPILTNAELTAVLNSYVTNGSLATTLAGYVTNDTLDAYKAEVSGEFAKYAKTDDMNDKFDDYVLISELDAKVDSHGYLKVEDITGKADKTQLDNYYTKGEIDTKVEGINASINGVDAKFAGYDTKGEVDTKISNALESYYDKDEVDGLISDLATAMNFVGVDTKFPDSAEDGDVFVLQTKDAEGKVISTAEYVWYQNDWQLLGDESLMGQISSRVDDAEGAIADNKSAIEVIYKKDGSAETGRLVEAESDIADNKSAIEAIYKKDGDAESGRLVEAESDIADNKAAIEAIYKVDGSEKSGVLVSEIARVEGLIDDAEAALTNMTVSQDGTGGDYVNAISRDADGNIKYTKAALPGLSAVVEPANSVNPSAHEMTVLTAVEDSGTAGHAVKLKVTKDVAVTKAGAEAIATDKASAAVIDFAAGITVSGSGPAVVNVEKSNDNKITFTKGTIKIDELAQDAGTYVIFDCGTASTLI